MTSLKGKNKKRTKSHADETPIQNSSAASHEALSEGGGLKAYLKKNQCFSVDLVGVCVQMGICSEDDIESIDSNAAFDEIYRQVRVLRAKDLKDNASRIRMEKQMTKFEKLWRAKTGIKKTSLKKKNKKQKKKDPKTAKNESMASSGATLKSWMRKNDVWEIALFDELVSRQIEPDDLETLKQNEFDEIVRKVRVDRFSQLKDQNARNRADKLLIRFEKKWRKASGIKKTSIR
eukprot:96168_1